MAIINTKIDFPIFSLHNCEDDDICASFNWKSEKCFEETGIGCGVFVKNDTYNGYIDFKVIKTSENIFDENSEFGDFKKKLKTWVKNNLPTMPTKELLMELGITENIISIDIKINGVNPNCEEVGTFTKGGCIHFISWLEDDIYHGKFKDYVLKEGNASYSFSLDYPLNNEYTKSWESENLTFHQLVTMVSESYKEIYDEEDESINAVDKTTLENHPENIQLGGLMNRPSTQGKWGIWGHDMGDLVLERVTLNEETGEFHLSIGS